MTPERIVIGNAELWHGDCRASMRGLIDQGVQVQMCVTSPPYFGLRDYGVDGQLGLEATPAEYVAAMVDVFGLVRELLADDGVLWLNLGDSYAGGGGHSPTAPSSATSKSGLYGDALKAGGIKPGGVIKQKDLIGIPWRVAFALQADGWYLRQDIIWAKPNPMPESVTDRCTKSHEYLFLLAKSARYYFDADAIAEPVTQSTFDRLSQPNLENQAGSHRVPGKTNGPMKAVGRASADVYTGIAYSTPQSEPRGPRKNFGYFAARNKRSVWTVATQPYAEAHFATFPPALIEPCILAGSRPGDTVLDPFFGSGTTGQVAQALGRRWIGCELNPQYEALIRQRTAQQGLALQALA